MGEINHREKCGHNEPCILRVLVDRKIGGYNTCEVPDLSFSPRRAARTCSNLSVILYHLFGKGAKFETSVLHAVMDGDALSVRTYTELSRSQYDLD